MVRASFLERGYRADGEGRGREAFVAVEWDEALDLIAGELDRVKQRHGNAAIYGGSYGWSSAGRFHHAQSQIHRFLNTIGGYTASVNSYSYGAAEVTLPHVIGTLDGLENAHTSWLSIEQNCELVVAFGGMPSKNTQANARGLSRHVFADRLARSARAGVEFVLVGPIRDDLQLPGSAWLPIRPTTDTALMLGLAHVLHTEGLCDRAFLASHTVGYERFAAYLAGATDGKEKSPAWAASICGIGEEEIAALARRMARSRTLLSMSWSVQRAEHGEQPYWMLITLAAMLGQIGLPGCGFGFGYGAVNGIGDYLAPFNWPSLPQGVNEVEEFIPVARIADALLSPGQSYRYNGTTRRYPHLRPIYWAGGI